MSYFVGLDVSQKITAICVVDDTGRRLWRGQCPTIPEQISILVRRHAGDDARIGIETGAMTPWLVHELRNRLLMSVPGIGVLSALAYVSTVEDPGRFGRSRSVGAAIASAPDVKTIVNLAKKGRALRQQVVQYVAQAVDMGNLSRGRS